MKTYVGGEYAPYGYEIYTRMSNNVVDDGKYVKLASPREVTTLNFNLQEAIVGMSDKDLIEWNLLCKDAAHTGAVDAKCKAFDFINDICVNYWKRQE